MLCFALLAPSMFAQIPTQTITKQLKLTTVPLGIGTENVLVRGVDQIVKRVPITSFSGITDAPSDGQNYFRNNANWAVVPLSGIQDAPVNGSSYVRNNANWVVAPLSGIQDAPVNGSNYVRNNANWVVATSVSPNLNQVISSGNQINSTLPFLPSIIVQDTSPSVSQSKTTISAYGLECSATGYSDKTSFSRMGVSWTNGNALYQLRLNGNATSTSSNNNIFLPKSGGWLLHTNYNEFADNATAIAGGLTFGDTYRTGDLLKIVHN